MSKLNDDGMENGSNGLNGDVAPAFDSNHTWAIRGPGFILQRDGQRHGGQAEHEHLKAEVGILFEPGAGLLSSWQNGRLTEHLLIAPLVYVVPPKTKHLTRWDAHSELLVGHVEQRFWSNVAPEASAESVTGGIVAAAKGDLVLWEFATLVRHLWDEGQSQDRSAKWAAHSLLARAVKLIPFEQPLPCETGSGLTPSRRRAMDDYIEKQIRFNLHAPDLAKVVGLSTPYFSTVLKRDTGMTPNAYLTRARMLRAFQLLITGDHCLGEVAAAVGYDDPVHFSRRFRRFFNYSPRMLMLRSRGGPFNRQGKP